MNNINQRPRIKLRKDYFPHFAAVMVTFGISFLLLVVIWIVYLPIPVSMQPLKVRFLIRLSMEERIMIQLPAETIVYSEPYQDSDILIELKENTQALKWQEIEKWYKIEIRDENIKGWVMKNYIQ